eukprot:gene5179-biopygen5517
MYVMTKYWAEILLIVSSASFWCAGYYTCFVWLVYYMTSLLGDNDVRQAWVINFWNTLILICLLPVAGHFGDYVCSKCLNPEDGFRYVMLLGLLLMLCGGCPAFLMVNHHVWWSAC